MPFNAFILEDDRNFLKLVEIRLRAWKKDIVITAAESLAQAQELFEQGDQVFSLAILDQHLPDGMGFSLAEHPRLNQAAVLAVSADDAPELPGATVKAGAQHFLRKRQISEPLFLPLLEALIERKKLEAELLKAQIQKSRMDSIRTLLGTLQHELNNPLGAVLGGTYLLRSGGELDQEQAEALRLIEESSNRIKHVITQLCEAAELVEVTKGKEILFQVPGDPEWPQKS